MDSLPGIPGVANFILFLVTQFQGPGHLSMEGHMKILVRQKTHECYLHEAINAGAWRQRRTFFVQGGMNRSSVKGFRYHGITQILVRGLTDARATELSAGEGLFKNRWWIKRNKEREKIRPDGWMVMVMMMMME